MKQSYRWILRPASDLFCQSSEQNDCDRMEGVSAVLKVLLWVKSGLHVHLKVPILFTCREKLCLNIFEQILRYIHFIANYSQEPRNVDRLFKIRSVLDTLKKTFRLAVDPENFQSIDEQIIPFNGHLSLKQIPKKPKPWGVKVWVRAGSSEYMHRFQV